MACTCADGPTRFIRNGNGRAICRDCRGSFPVPQQADHEAVSFARVGYAPEHDLRHPAAPGFQVRAVSSLYDANGVLKAQWVKSSQDAEQQAAMLAAAREAFAADLPQVEPRLPTSKAWLRKLMACYPIGDAHIGMLSWKPETGEEWDLAIAERVQCGAMKALVDGAPSAAKAVIVNLGDWYHYDSMEPVTARSGHVLDADGRYAKMVGVGIKVMRQCIESALSKHREVHVINVVGNHDDTGALWLSAALAHVYENEPRVTIDTNPSPFTYFQHGKTLVGCHHGHSCKPDKLAGVMAADRPEQWGATKHRYWWLGHVHHQSVKEYPGVSVETFGTLAAKDAWATSGGYRAARNMKCIVLHEDHGEVARQTVNPAMLEAA